MFTDFDLFSLLDSLFNSNVFSLICFVDVSPSDSEERHLYLSRDFLDYVYNHYRFDLSSFVGNFYSFNSKMRILNAELYPQCYDDFVSFVKRVKMEMLDAEI